MSTISRIAGVVAGLAVVATLAVGVAAPAQADPRLRTTFPTCSTMLKPTDFVAGHFMYRWSPTSTTGLLGSADSYVQTMIRRSRGLTCSWARSAGAPATISEVQLSVTDLGFLRNHFAAIGSVGQSHGGPALAYYVPNKAHPTWIELDTLFPNGTLVATLDRSGTVNGAMMQEAVDVIVALNPGINGLG